MRPSEPAKSILRPPPWVIILLSITLAFIVLVIIWQLAVASPLRARLAAYRAAGEPVCAADLSSSGSVAPERNAAEFLTGAIRALRLSKESAEAFEYGRWFDPEYEDSRRVAVRTNAKALAQVRAARCAPEVDWGLQFVSPITPFQAPHVSGAQRLARLTIAAAREALDRGETAEALAYLRDAVGLARVVAVGVPGIVADLAQAQIVGMSAESVEIVGMCGDLCDPVAAGQARALREELLDCVPQLERGLLYALTTQRVFLIDGLDIAARGGTTSAPPFFAPAVNWGAALALDYETAVLDAARQGDFPSVLAAIPDYPVSTLPAMQVAETLTIRGDWAISLNFRARALASLAATSLAIRLSDAECGRPLCDLKDLPDEFRPVPTDIFAPDGRPLSMVIRGGKRSLYSFGHDGEDQAGSYLMGNDGFVDQEMLDLVFFLDEVIAPPRYWDRR